MPEPTSDPFEVPDREQRRSRSNYSEIDFLLFGIHSDGRRQDAKNIWRSVHEMAGRVNAPPARHHLAWK